MSSTSPDPQPGHQRWPGGGPADGDSALSSYEGVRTWFRGFPQMPDEAIPLYMQR